MTTVHIKFECRHPASFGIDPVAQYRAAMEQIRWADEHGFSVVNFCEHHGSEDGYLPAPMAMAAAAAAVTSRVRLRVNLVMAFHDPVRVAEDLAVIDLISGGRVELAALGGYVPSEFAMFGKDLEQRGRAVAEAIEVIDRAWRGEHFEWRGRQIHVTPRPAQQPRPRILAGGNVPAAARRAARLADAFIPMIPESFAVYAEACRELGKQPVNEGRIGPVFLHVSKDPDRDWQRIAPHALYETNCYARWQAQTGVSGHFQEMTDADALRASGSFAVLTPEQVLALAEELGEDGQILLHPLMGGMDPALGQASLDLFAREVIPHLRVKPCAES